jgi:hypothetical protein
MFPFAGEHQPALLPAVEALLDAVGLTELAEVLDGHPELLDPGADLVITQFMAVAVMQDDNALTEAFGRRLRLVRLARKDGAEAALADLRSKVIADQPTELRTAWEAAVATDGRGKAQWISRQPPGRSPPPAATATSSSRPSTCIAPRSTRRSVTGHPATLLWRWKREGR